MVTSSRSKVLLKEEAFVALSMTRQNSQSNRSRGIAPIRHSFGEIRDLVWPYKRLLVGGLVALAAGSGINLLFPEVIRRLLDPAVFASLAPHLSWIFLGLAALFVLQGGVFYLRSLFFGLLGQRVYAVLRERLFNAITSQPVPFFDQQRSGDLASRINSDAALIQDLVSVKISVILRYGAQVLVGTVLMAFMSWRMTLAIIASVVCIVVVSTVFVRSLRAASRAYQSALATLSAFAAECFSSAKVLRALAAEHQTQTSFADMSAAVLRAGEVRVTISAAFSSGASLLLNILLLAVLWYGVSLVVSERLPLNDLAAFALYGAIVAVSFSFLVSAYSELVQNVGGLERVFELVRSERGVARERAGGLQVPKEEGLSVAFQDVSFSYPERLETPVLDNFSLHISAGSSIGIMGPSGAGKSSILQLLLKFYEPTSGQILINNTPLHGVDERDLRSRIAWVPQEPLLFGFSIYDNLVLGTSGASRDEVLAQVKRWGFLEFLETLPQGIDTILGEHGARLSGGQRQRLAIARALLRKPSVLLLDEATSALDTESEEKILKAIHTELPMVTIVMVSHRITSVRAADQIVVINEGRVVEQGTHESLVVGSGLYRYYAERQFGIS